MENKPGFPGKKKPFAEVLKSKETTTDFRTEMLASQAYMDENQSYFRIYALSSFIASGNSGLSELEGIKFAQ